jgi:predicted RNA-binding Zn ribbon-like protein
MTRAAGADVRPFTDIGGHVALNLVNTVRWRLDPSQRIDDLTSYACVLTWAQQVKLISDQEEAELQAFAAAEPRWAAAEFDQFVRMREAAYAALVDDSVLAVDELVVTQREALQRARLTKTGGRWEWREPTPTLTTPRDRAVRQVIDLLTSADLPLLHQCEDRACGWVYLDTSPRHNRRWCVAADCGNRNRARRFYARQQTGS